MASFIPSAEQVTASQYPPQTVFQEAPEFVEVFIAPPPCIKVGLTTIILLPSAEQAQDLSGDPLAPDGIQVLPESCDVNAPDDPMARIVAPSAEQAIATQFAQGAEVLVQLVPAFVEV